MPRMLGAILLTLLVSGCSRFETWNANIIVWNRSPYTLRLRIEGVELGKILPTNPSANFTTKITTPRPASTMTSPSMVRRAQISVAIINEATGIMTSPISCNAGEDLRTVIVYESSYQAPGSSPNFWCSTEYSY